MERRGVLFANLRATPGPGETKRGCGRDGKSPKGSANLQRPVPASPHPTVPGAVSVTGGRASSTPGTSYATGQGGSGVPSPLEHPTSDQPGGHSDTAASKTRIRLQDLMFPTTRHAAHQLPGSVTPPTRAEGMTGTGRTEARGPTKTFRTGGQDCRATQATDTSGRTSSSESHRSRLPSDRRPARTVREPPRPNNPGPVGFFVGRQETRGPPTIHRRNLAAPLIRSVGSEDPWDDPRNPKAAEDPDPKARRLLGLCSEQQGTETP